MIIELLFRLVLSIFQLMLNLVPQVNFQWDVPDLSFFSDMMGLANYFFPVGQLMTGISVIVFCQNLGFILKVFNWIYNKIPFI